MPGICAEPSPVGGNLPVDAEEGQEGRAETGPHVGGDPGEAAACGTGTQRPGDEMAETGGGVSAGAGEPESGVKQAAHAVCEPGDNDGGEERPGESGGEGETVKIPDGLEREEAEYLVACLELYKRRLAVLNGPDGGRSGR